MFSKFLIILSVVILQVTYADPIPEGSCKSFYQIQVNSKSKWQDYEPKLSYDTVQKLYIVEIDFLGRNHASRFFLKNQDNQCVVVYSENPIIVLEDEEKVFKGYEKVTSEDCIDYYSRLNQLNKKIEEETEAAEKVITDAQELETEKEKIIKRNIDNFDERPSVNMFSCGRMRAWSSDENWLIPANK